MGILVLEIKIHPQKINGWNPKSWSFGLDDIPDFNLGDF